MVVQPGGPRRLVAVQRALLTMPRRRPALGGHRCGSFDELLAAVDLPTLRVHPALANLGNAGGCAALTGVPAR
jgi:hypothetical protein